MPSTPAPEPVLEIADYTLDYEARAGAMRALDRVSLSIGRGEVLGLVGESGSGKSSLAWAIMRALPPNARERGGAIRLGGRDLIGATPVEMASLRGKRIGMVFQDPATSLNPTLTVGEQVAETLRFHRSLDRMAAWEEAKRQLDRVHLRGVDALMTRYPHEVSGGEKQRVILATVFACGPDCLLFDEPTTALDVVTARQVLDVFAELQRETGVASLYISHDLAVVSRVAARVAVILRGEIVETGPTQAVFAAPAHAYTKSLVDAVPRPDRRLVADAPDPGANLLRVEGLGVRYGRVSLLGSLLGRARAPHVGAADIAFDVAPGEIVGLVGESGSGKSTVGRALAGLVPFEGGFAFGGKSVAGLRDMSRAYRRDVQIVFQHPDSSLNPRQKIGEILARPAKLHGLADASTPEALLESVRLPASYASRYPHQLSGGEKQRVAIARAFAASPKLVICDEVTSALDVSVQASVIELLLELRRRFGTAYLFVSHDINLVRQIAHRIAVMRAGRIVETISAADLARDGPAHPYTAELIAAVPTLAAA